MKFEVRKASDWDYKKTVEINTLEELIDFAIKNKSGLIVNPKYPDSDDGLNMITIYDDYIE